MNFLPILNGLFKNKLIVGIFKLLKVEKWHTEPVLPQPAQTASCGQCPAGFLPAEGPPLNRLSICLSQLFRLRRHRPLIAWLLGSRPELFHEG